MWEIVEKSKAAGIWQSVTSSRSLIHSLSPPLFRTHALVDRTAVFLIAALFRNERTRWIRG